MNLDGLCYKCMQFGNSGGVCTYCGSAAVGAQSVAYALPVGTILHGSYLIGSMLGAGGFGITYIALHLPTNRRVCVKEFLPTDFAMREPGKTHVTDNADNDGFARTKKSFLREARTIYQLRGYAGVVSVEKMFEENNTAYYVMEYLDGCDLKRYLKNAGGRLPVEELDRLLAPVFDSLSFIHSQGIVHRDISPDNIFVCRDGSVKLIDFGAAFAAARERSQSMALFVKRGYAPVEQYMTAGNTGPWTDEYAFACTIYHCLTGRVPPEAPERNYADALVPPSALGVDISPMTERALLQAMSVHAQDRFSTINAFRKAYYFNGFVPVLAQKPTFSMRWRSFWDRVRGKLGIGPKTAMTSPQPLLPQGSRRLALACVSGVFKGSLFPLAETAVCLGRDPVNCGIVFPPETLGVSRVHCAVCANPSSRLVTVQDLGSRFGTQIMNGTVLSSGQSGDLPVGTGFALGNEWFTVTEMED